MYKAIFYIGRKYRPGELIREEIEPEKLKHLIEIGAVEKVTAPDDDFQDIEDLIPEETEEEVGEDAEAPEIDVMAGIVQEEVAEEPKKPARARKTTGRGKKS